MGKTGSSRETPPLSGIGKGVFFDWGLLGISPLGAGFFELMSRIPRTAAGEFENKFEESGPEGGSSKKPLIE